MWAEYNRSTVHSQEHYVNTIRNMSGNEFQQACNGLMHTGALGSAWYQEFANSQFDRFFTAAALSVRKYQQPVMPITHSGLQNGLNLYHAWLISGYKVKENFYYSDRIEILTASFNDPLFRKMEHWSLPLLRHRFASNSHMYRFIVGLPDFSHFITTTNAWYTNFVNSGSSYYGGPPTLEICLPMIPRSAK